MGYTITTVQHSFTQVVEDRMKAGHPIAGSILVVLLVQTLLPVVARGADRIHSTVRSLRPTCRRLRRRTTTRATGGVGGSAVPVTPTLMLLWCDLYVLKGPSWRDG